MSTSELVSVFAVAEEVIAANFDEEGLIQDGGQAERSWHEEREEVDGINWLELSEYTCPENPDLWMYRERTVGLLRRYAVLSVETGRLPSLLGREFFRTQVTSYNASTFEDVVIFVHDVERSLEKLGGFEQQIIARIVLQEYTQEEAAHLLGCAGRTIRRRFPEALDRLSDIFLRGELLKPIANPPTKKNCQEGERGEKFACYSNHGE